MLLLLHRLAAIFLLACSCSTFSGTLGDRIALRYYYPGLGTPTAIYSTQMVDSDGALFSNVAGVFDPTITDTQIIANNFNAGRATNMDGFSLANVSISGNSAYVNWQGLAFDENTQVLLYISAIPEPDHLAMLLGGACMVVLRLRRAKYRQGVPIVSAIRPGSGTLGGTHAARAGLARLPASWIATAGCWFR